MCDRIIMVTFFLIFAILLLHPAQGIDTQSENMQKSRDVVQELYKVLFNKLSTAIREGGIEKAIDLCHRAAQEITDSFKNDKQSVRRVSLQMRNFKNKPDLYEKEKLTLMMADHKRGKLKNEYYEIVDQGGVKYFRYLAPILIKPPCLNCHGKKERLSPSVVKILKVKYPKDKAFNYRNGDLRGAFSVIIKQYY